jgi:hypothetical protein
MIERFYDPLIGRVTLDGIDIKDLNVGSYRSNVSLVSQEPTLYAGTVRFNVKLGASKPMDQVTEEEVVQACKDANIVCPLFPSVSIEDAGADDQYDFVMSLPDGFDTEVGGKGSQLSGGQVSSSFGSEIGADDRNNESQSLEHSFETPKSYSWTKLPRLLIHKVKRLCKMLWTELPRVELRCMSILPPHSRLFSSIPPIS